jgi:hypothetical protein
MSATITSARLSLGRSAFLAADQIEYFEGAPPIDHEILRDDLKPIDNGLFRQNMPIMWHAQADPNAVFSESVVGICGHKSLVLEGLCFHARERHAPPGPTILGRPGPAQSQGERKEPSLPRGTAPGARRYGRLGVDHCYQCGLLPSVAQPPLPLQSFLPQFLPPPWPLQSFWPLHACLGRGCFSGSAIVWRETPAWLGVLAA